MIVDERVEIADVRLAALPVDPAVYRRRVIFDCCKWDPQVGDANTIGDHAALLSPATASRLSNLAESLAAETLALEQALHHRPDLYAGLGIPASLRKLLSSPPLAPSARIMRFDFHPTTEGWSLSEVNSDVPGGFAEASALPQLAASYLPRTRPGPDAAAELVAALSRHIGARKRIAFVHATSYADDRQVMHFLAKRFAADGFSCSLLAPDHLRWNDGRAVSIAEGQSGPVDAAIRFFPADWLPRLPMSSNWRGYFRSTTPLSNPPQALLSQSKRLPLVWESLGVSVPTWRSVLPETRDPRDAPWRTDDSWLLKPALGRVGEDIAWRGSLSDKLWRKQSRSVALYPRHWIAQRRFRSRPLATSIGPRHLCVGVFTIDGRAAGFYGRLAAGPIVEKHAQDVPVLISS